jgi:trans-aconitate methyltransferase
MDQQTLDAYDRDAAAFTADWDAQPTPADLQAAVLKFFRPGQTADIGCGSGRDTAWLVQIGFAAIGLDSSEGILAEARRLHPHIDFRPLLCRSSTAERTAHSAMCCAKP